MRSSCIGNFALNARCRCFPGCRRCLALSLCSSYSTAGYMFKVKESPSDRSVYRPPLWIRICDPASLLHHLLFMLGLSLSRSCSIEFPGLVWNNLKNLLRYQSVVCIPPSCSVCFDQETYTEVVFRAAIRLFDCFYQFVGVLLRQGDSVIKDDCAEFVATAAKLLQVSEKKLRIRLLSRSLKVFFSSETDNMLRKFGITRLSPVSDRTRITGLSSHTRLRFGRTRFRLVCTDQKRRQIHPKEGMMGGHFLTPNINRSLKHLCVLSCWRIELIL